MIRRTPLKKKPYKLKKSPLRKISERGLIKKEEKAEQTKKQFKLFDKLWKEQPHFCRACGNYLGEENKSIFWDHLLPKSKFDCYRFTEENLYLVCFNCHSLKESGFPHPKHKYAIDRMMKKHLNNEL